MSETNPSMFNVPVLNNSGYPPMTTLQHRGINQCLKIQLGRKVFPMANPTSILRYWCKALGLAADDDSKLAGLLRAAVTLVPQLRVLPPIAPACFSGGGKSIPGISDDPLLSVAVVARTAGGVFIGHKSPIICGQSLNEQVTLILPINWREKP